MENAVRWLQGTPSGMLGAPPAVVKKWFPERTDAEWDQIDEADRFTLLNQANLVEAQWNAKINEMRYNGACDATKPGLLAGAMREHLIASGGKLENMDDLGAKSFGPKDCLEWVRVFKKAPDQESVAKAIGLATGGTSPWVQNGANGRSMQITLNAVCPSGFTLPKCAVSGGPPPAECGPTKPCPEGSECIDGKCQPITVAKTGKKSSSGLGLLLLGGAAALGAIFIVPALFNKPPLPPRPGDRLQSNPNDNERELWVRNDEGLYRWWRSSRQSMREFVRSNRKEIDAAISRVLGR